MYDFVAVKTKDDHLHIRLKPSVKDELKIVADARGMTMSGLVYSLIVKTIRDEKNHEPELFMTRGIRAAEVKLAPVVARIEPAKKATTKDDVRRMINDDEIASIRQQLKPRKRKAG